MKRVNYIANSFLQLLFPHICCGCGSDALGRESVLCLHCIDALPCTGFSSRINNPIEKKFWGRIPLMAASAEYYFSRNSVTQTLMHQLKYKGLRELGIQLGRMIGISLLQSNRFQVNALIPLPLFPARERRRGYNQAALLCDGISEILKVPVLKQAVIRSQHTETQTSKGRVERWQNMEGRFLVSQPGLLSGKHVLLVDDVITTGATLEACGMEILKTEGVQLSIAALCYADH